MNKQKKVRLYINGERQKDVYQYATKWQVFKFKARRFIINVLFWGFIVSIVGIGFYIYYQYNPSIVYTRAEVIKEVPVKASVMDRIAKCESPTGHYDSNGQVALNANSDHSVDIGKYQINNKVWGKKATEMGLNLMVEKDNEQMAQYIYQNYGTGAWYSSSKCWSK